jgi:hypothetical protein
MPSRFKGTIFWPTLPTKEASMVVSKSPPGVNHKLEESDLTQVAVVSTHVFVTLKRLSTSAL